MCTSAEALHGNSSAHFLVSAKIQVANIHLSIFNAGYTICIVFIGCRHFSLLEKHVLFSISTEYRGLEFVSCKHISLPCPLTEEETIPK